METMSKKMGVMGGNMGGTFDDGVFDGVKKIFVGKDIDCVSYIKIEYEKDGKVETREHGMIRGELAEFLVDYPNEYITVVGGSYDHVFRYGTVLIKSLVFKTTYGRTSPIFGVTLLGKPAGREFMLEGKNGGKLLGFHGRSGQALDAIGTHFFAANSPLKHFNLQGENGGRAWDDGAFDGVRKVLVGRGGKFVSYVSFEYAKGENLVPHSHGKRQEAPQEFVVDYPNEHITLVEGTIDGYLSSLTFKTSKGRNSPTFGNVAGRKFVFGEKYFKLVGFCGRSGDAIDALGAHFAPLPSPTPAPAPTLAPTSPLVPSTPGSSEPQKLEAQGGEGGDKWDDGADHDGVINIYVAGGGLGIENIKFDYVKNGKTKEGTFHGVKARAFITTIAISHPDEYLVSVDGWYDSSNIIQGIKFQTNKNTSDIIGYEFSGDGTQFSLQVKDKKIIGFHGFAASHLNSLGAYFAPSGIATTPLTPSFKLPAQGGNGGVSWDDGVHDNVRRVFVGQGDSGVAFVKFEYNKGSVLLTGDGHGKMSKLGTEEFVVDPNDYITSVKVYYEKLSVSKTEIITALRFKTFKGLTSQPFGMTSSWDFSLLEGGKITGFHGTSSEFLHSIGAYMSLSSTPMLRGKWIQVKQKSKGPGPRCSHAIAMVGDNMYSFGGELTPNKHIDQHLYVFDFKTQTWSLAPPNGDVPDLPCLGVCMVAIGTTLYVFGGRDGDRNYNGFYSYDTVKSEWKLITHVDKGPAPRSFHSMATDGKKGLLMYGGKAPNNGRYDDIFFYGVDSA